MSKQQGPAMVVTLADKRTVIRINDLDGHAIKAIRHETGQGPQYWFRNHESIDVDIIAAFMWAVQRQTKPKQSYDDVLGAMNYADVDVDFVAEASELDAEEDDNPEA